jgi:trimethyllysine dioxygenase
MSSHASPGLNSPDGAVACASHRNDDHGMTLQWADGTESVYPWFWLRDHGEDEASLDPDTLQRRVDTFTIPTDQRGAAVEHDATTQTFRISWADNTPPTTISVLRLAQIAGKAVPEGALGPHGGENFWAAGNLPDPLPVFDFANVTTTDDANRAWQEAIHVYGFAVMENCEASEDGTRLIANRIAPAQVTIFGDYWTLSSEIADHGDTAYTNQFLEPHTDSTYYHDAPGLQMFNCLEFDGKGGESTLLDGFAIARQMQAECPEHYETLTRISVPGRYLEPGVHLRAERPPFRLDRNGRLAQISFNNYDRAPFILPPDEMQAFYAAYGEFHSRVMDQSNWLKIPLRPGMSLIFDNWRCLHGRMGYVGKRVFHGCYIGRADFESRLRTLQAA